jgi:hypothetical protein
MILSGRDLSTNRSSGFQNRALPYIKYNVCLSNVYLS